MPHRSRVAPDLIARASALVAKQQRDEDARIRAFGQVRPIMFTPAFGEQLVAVRNEIFKVPEKSTFTNFLFNHGLHRLGDAWLEAQNRHPLTEQHPLFILHGQAMEFVNQQPRKPEGHVCVVPNGPLSFCERFYYDLYIVDDNNMLDADLLHRLRNREKFQGAMHELFVEATCLRAGFRIIREVHAGPKPRNVEFIAVHNATQQHIAVEAKSRHRDGVLGIPGERDDHADTRFGKLINNAASKDPNNPLAIFVDTNLPIGEAEDFYRPVSLDPVLLSEQISSVAERVRLPDGRDPYNLLVFTNHPQHYAEGRRAGSQDRWAAIISPNPRVQLFHESALKDLMKALDLYGNVPTDFPKLIPNTNIPA